MTDQEMQAEAERAGFNFVERKRGAVLVWLPTRRVRWVSEPINGDRRKALTRALDRAAQDLAGLKA